MNSSKKSILNSNFTYLAAFVLPVIMMMALYYTRGIFPWGNECYLRSDMYHQYAPFFSELWHKIRNGESLTYSWNIGMGTNFTSLFAYYLASPSNWFVALFPQKYTIEIMNAFIILKIVGRFFEDGKVKRMSLFCIGDAETLQIFGTVFFCPAGGMNFQIKNRADGIVEGGKRPECGNGFC